MKARQRAIFQPRYFHGSLFAPGLSLLLSSRRPPHPPGTARHQHSAQKPPPAKGSNIKCVKCIHYPVTTARQDPRPRAGRRTRPTSAWRWSAARTPAQPPDRGAPGPPPGTRTSRGRIAHMVECRMLTIFTTEVTDSGSNISDPTSVRDPSAGSRRGRLVLALLAGRGGRQGRQPYKVCIVEYRNEE